MNKIQAEIQSNVKRIVSGIPQGVRLVAVSKYNSNDRIQAAYSVGQRFFGESRAQELVPKAQSLPKDIAWHFIGHLQTNKVKNIVPYVSCIESVDSFRLLSEINKQAMKINKVIPCLLQFHIAVEETKFGFDIDECEQMLLSDDYKELKNVSIIGVMGMASITNDIDYIRKEFRQIKQIYTKIKANHFADDDKFSEISMGMTHDYQIAIEEGSTIVRVGSGIFGERMYDN